MRLRTLLEAARTRRTLTVRALNQRPAVEAVARNLAERFDEATRVPAPEELTELLQRFRRHRFKGFTKREWARAIWGIWDKQFPLSEVESFWHEFAAFLRANARRTHYKNLILAYLRDFEPDSDDFRIAGDLIRNFLSSGQEDWLWTKRQNRFRLFEPTEAPESIASHMLDEGKSIDEALQEVGCSGVVIAGGLEKAAFGRLLERWLARSKRGLSDSTALTRILSWAEYDGSLRFPTLTRRLAESLLLPWREQRPEAALMKAITEFLLKHLGDPRIERQRWIGVNEAAQQVMRRWLTKASLEQFIAVVSKVADAGHWKYRKAFWMAYYDRDHIDEAWVLFGRDARNRAANAFEESAGYGELIGGLSNHCVLLLRIGNLTIADWSHSGKCRMWNGGNTQAPKLYQRAPYHVTQLQKDPDFEQAHHGSDRHSWQERVAEEIQSRAGVWVPTIARKPRGG